MPPSEHRTLPWAALAVAVALPRWLYLTAQVTQSPSWKAVAWAGDVVCLVVAAVSIWSLQQRFGDDDSRRGMLFAIAGFALDAATTFAVPWLATPAPVVFAAVAAWTWGTSTWLAARCRAADCPYFLFRLAFVTIGISTVLRILQPEWPAFPSALVIDTGIAVQCVLVARAVFRGDISAP